MSAYKPLSLFLKVNLHFFSLFVSWNLSYCLICIRKSCHFKSCFRLHTPISPDWKNINLSFPEYPKPSASKWFDVLYRFWFCIYVKKISFNYLSRAQQRGIYLYIFLIVIRIQRVLWLVCPVVCSNHYPASLMTFLPAPFWSSAQNTKSSRRASYLKSGEEKRFLIEMRDIR